MDSTDKHAVLKALIDCEAQKKAIADGFSGLLIFFTTDLVAQWANEATHAEFPDAIGRHCYEIFCAKNEQCKICALERCLETGKIETTTQRISVDVASNDDIVFDITASPVHDTDGKISGIIIIAQSVTEKYALEKQLRHTQKMEAIGTLAGGVAHDFNNVLTPIMGYTEIIRIKLEQDCYQGDKVYTYLDEILKASTRAKSLVEQVLTFSRSSEQKAVSQLLHPIVKEVMKLMRVTLPSTLTIVEEVDETCGRVLIDPVQIHQVLINLCTNASHAMSGTHGTMTVKVAPAPPSVDGKDWVELSVADSGSGIEADDLERIFEPYFSTKEKTHGTGMGLAMVHGIINAQGGHIDVESEVGKGTVFKIHLPLVQNSQAAVADLGEIKGGTGRVILIDDEDQVVQVTGEILKNLGYGVVGKTSPVEALELFSASPYDFDLVLTDLTMPGLTGLELSAKIKSIRADIPIVLFTGYSDLVSKEEATQAGIDEYCMKPISMRDLSNVLRKCLVRE
ncbi:MAG: two-component system cell cycle sensor histidine kinase/response regulator CckA [Desulforhopalus sp.]